MAYKQIDQTYSFAEIAIQNYIAKNRTFTFLRQVEDSINWEPVEALLLKYYRVGKSKEGERAYSPVLLFRCLLLQKWYKIKSDPELESQINDRISFRSFLKLPHGHPVSRSLHLFQIPKAYLQKRNDENQFRPSYTISGSWAHHKRGHCSGCKNCCFGQQTHLPR